MNSCWISFAENGDPNRGGMPDFWISRDSSEVFEFGEKSGMIKEPLLQLYQIMDRMYGWE